VKLAGRGAFGRGVDYFDAGRVSDIESTERSTTAVVNGSQQYTVMLRHTHRHLEGACDCPASEGIEFCKHCVALALALQVRQTDASQVDKKSPNTKIRDYLSQQSRDSLVEELIDVAQRYPVLRESLLQKAEFSSEKLTFGQLKKLITRVTPARDLWSYREVGAYFQGLESTLDRIADIADRVEPQALLRTTEYGIQRLERVLESVDDSGGYRFGSQEILCQLHINALRRLAWAPSRLAAYLVDLTLSDSWNPFSDSPGEYNEILNDASLAAFFAEIELRMDALPKLPVGAEFDQKNPYIRLSRFLESRAREAGDIDDLIRIKQRIATDARDYCEIARLFLDTHDTEAAAEWLNKADGLAKHDHEYDLGLWVDLHAARQDWGEAVRVQTTLFEKSSDYDDYRWLLELASRMDQDERVREEVKTWLHEKLNSRGGGFGSRAFMLAQILRDEGDWQGAFETLVEHTAHQDWFEEAAAWFENARPDYACELYRLAIEAWIDRKNKTGYQAAADLLVRVKPIFAKLPDDAFAELVTHLRETHKRKPNLMAALEDRGL
jgi:uncharacterized Zn finger protein